MRRKKPSKRPPRRPPKGAPRYVWVSTEEGVVWVDDQGTDRNLPSAEQVRSRLRAQELQQAERKRLEAEQRRQAEAARSPIRFKCPVCLTWIEVPVEREGEKERCPSCKSSMIVPPPRLVPSATALVGCLDCDGMGQAAKGVCAECGKPLPLQKHCEKCGDVLVRKGVAFCPGCGFELCERD